jgi:hypothetical protein
MKKQLLKERFQQLAGIKPLYEQPRNEPGRFSRGAKYPYGQSDTDVPQEPLPTKKAAAVLSHDEYKDIYFGDEEEFEEEGFEFIETFNPSSPYTFVMWNDEDLDVYDYASEEEFIVEFSEMGFGMCDDRECSMAEIVEVINDSQPDRDSTHGLALLSNGKVIAQGGDSGMNKQRKR